MKTVRMKGKNVEEAISAALAVLGASKGQVEVKVISEGKPALLGVIGGEEAEVEVIVGEVPGEEARQVLQNILDKMGFLAVAELAGGEAGNINLIVSGDDVSRIIGKEGTMLKALETIVGSILWKVFGNRIRVNIDAGGYREKRIRALERLAEDVAKEVEGTGEEKELPHMEAADRRTIHLYLQNNPTIMTYSKGEGRERRLIVAPKK